MAYRSVSCALLMEKLSSEHSLTKGISYKERHSGIFGSWKEMRPWYFCKGGKRFKKDVSLLYYAYLEIYFEQSLFIVWWCMPLIPALRKQRHANIYKFKASLVYTTSSRTARDTQPMCIQHRNPMLNIKQTKSVIYFLIFQSVYTEYILFL